MKKQRASGVIDACSCGFAKFLGKFHREKRKKHQQRCYRVLGVIFNLECPSGLEVSENFTKIDNNCIVSESSYSTQLSRIVLMKDWTHIIHVINEH